MTLRARNPVNGPYGRDALVRAIPRYWADRSLRFAFLAAMDARRVSVEVLYGAAPTNATAIEGMSPFGPTLVTNGSTNWLQYAAWKGAPARIGGATTPFTLVAIIKPISGDAGKRYMLTLGGGGGGDSIGIVYDFTNNAFGCESNTDDYGSASSAAADGKSYVIVATKSNTAKVLYQDGVQLVSTTNGNADDALGPIALGANGANTGDNPGRCACPLFMVFDRLFSANEALEISKGLRPVSQLGKWPSAYVVPAGAAATKYPQIETRITRGMQRGINLGRVA